MSELNPYEKFLDGRPIQDILAATPATLAGLIETIGPSRAKTPPAPGKWNAAEIISHLADCELVFAFRLRQTLAEDNHTVQPFDQENGPFNIPASLPTRPSVSSPPCADGTCSFCAPSCPPLRHAP